MTGSSPRVNSLPSRFGLLLAAALAALLVMVAWPGDAAAQSCGNGNCQGGEDCTTCPLDCGACTPTCGDGSCDPGESCATCAGDCGACPAVCGDATCDTAGGEDCSTCAADCGACPATCGDGSCDVGESCSTCAADCGLCTTCGDTVCDPGEDCATCAADCGACVCGDAVCQSTEDCSSCAADCGACTTCGNSICDPGETGITCPNDCSVAGSDFATCPPDLPACTSDANDCCYRSFGAGSIVIPMDRCHQAVDLSNGKRSPPTGITNSFCADVAGGGDDGMFQAYGLAYRLMQNDIPVYWMINPTKDPPALTASQQANSQTYTDRDIDFWVLSNGATAPVAGGSLSSCTSPGCTPPVAHLDPSTLSPVAGSYNYQQFPTRGASFIIAAEDRARFDQFWTKTGLFAGNAGNSFYDFSDVDLFEVQSGAEVVYLDYRGSSPYAEFNGGNSGPVAVTLDYPSPRLARQSPAAVSDNWLAIAKLNEPASYPACKTGGFSPGNAVYCDLTDADMETGFLISGRFDWAWIDNWNPPGGNCSAATTQAMNNQIREFMRAVPGVKDGNSVLMMEGSIAVAESCTDKEPLGASGGLDISNQTPGEPLIMRYPTNIFSQFGDLPAEFASGSVGKWGYSSNGYQTMDSLTRLISEDTGTLCVNHKSTAACDVFGPGGDSDDLAAYARFEDEPANGVVFYMGGRNIMQNSNMSHLRMVLNAFLAIPTGLVRTLPTSASIIEVTRSSPIVATVDGIEAQYQGTIDVIDPPQTVTAYGGSADDNTFRFPHFTGHMRAIDVAVLSSTETTFDSLPEIFDAADEIPPVNTAGCGTPFTSACRTVFTNIVGGQKPDRIFVHTGNVNQLKPLMAPALTDANAQTLISRVLAGNDDDGDGAYEPKLGGVDRSTVAVIEQSPTIGNVRPTMVYFGALDGMLHAVCAEALGPCNAKGQELWAYIPRTQLPLLKDNLQRVDGSVKVADVFGDFDGNGSNEFRTVLTFQVGSGDAGFPDQAPAVIALDITFPENPVILWDNSTPATRGSFELGIGLGLAMGPVKVGTDVKHYTFAQTNNGGLGGAGFVLIAYDTVTGAEAWRTTHAYPAPRTSGNPVVPTTGIPGGVAAYSEVQGAATLTHVVVPSLYGDLWLYDAVTGLNEHGTVPLFRFSSDFHPIGAAPTIFVDDSGKLSVLAVSGGYADPTAALWSPQTATQYAVAFPLDVTSVPVDETGTTFTINLGAGNRAFAQATVAGGEIFIVTDSTDINSSSFGVSTSNTGLLHRHSITGAAITTGIILPGGAGSVDVTSTGVVHSGSGKAAKKEDFSGTFNANGEATELSFAALVRRGMWLSR